MKIKKLKILTLFLMAFFVFGCVDTKNKSNETEDPLKELNENQKTVLNEHGISINPAPTGKETTNLKIVLKSKDNKNMIDSTVCLTNLNSIKCLYDYTRNIGQNGDAIFDNIIKDKYKIRIIHNGWVFDSDKPESAKNLIIVFVKNNTITTNFNDASIVDLKNDTILNIQSTYNFMN